MKASRSSKKTSGFTLVELIVVLVILATLAALLVPSLTGYIDKARHDKPNEHIAHAMAKEIMALAEITEDECEWRIYIASPNEEGLAALATILQLDYCDKNYRVTYWLIGIEDEPAGWGQPVPSEHLEDDNSPDGGPFLTWKDYTPGSYHPGS